MVRWLAMNQRGHCLNGYEGADDITDRQYAAEIAVRFTDNARTVGMRSRMLIMAVIVRLKNGKEERESSCAKKGLRPFVEVTIGLHGRSHSLSFRSNVSRTWPTAVTVVQMSEYH